ncbi:TIGR02757 family protein [Roseimarinus sediminis]|uniref:TIGR02757 family protein n=1 Tax=Roseimarinus sediminis TaxID=1610899 RepID=UPI003D1E36CB
MKNGEIKTLLDEKYEQYNVPGFIIDDPISIPHLFDKKEDIEIAGFLTAIIAWGQRKSIIGNAHKLMKRMGYYPHEFILNAGESDFRSFNSFVHRTFNGTDAVFFLKSLRNIYLHHGGLEAVFTRGFLREQNLYGTLLFFRTIFLETKHEQRSEKHLANVAKNSSAKRLCMFLRWMVRNDKRGVDFALWKEIPPSALMLPLDVHTGNISRQLGLLKRKQNNWQAVEEVTAALRKLDPLDPVKYDLALFGLGVNKAL